MTNPLPARRWEIGPALRELEVPSVRDLVANGRHDARRFARLEDDHDGIGLGAFEIRIDEFVTTALRRFDNREVALLGPLRHPALKLVGDAAQCVSGHRVHLAVGIETAAPQLWLLDRLNQPVENTPAKTAIWPIESVFLWRYWRWG